MSWRRQTMLNFAIRCIALVGYGERARSVAETLHARGLAVTAHDRLLARAADCEPLRAHAQAHRVRLHGVAADAVVPADLVLSVVSADQGVAAAEAVAPYLALGTWFVDLNAASAGARRRVAGIVDAAGGRFVAGAFTDHAPSERRRVQIRLAGAHAQGLLGPLRAIGLDAACVAGGRRGVVSASPSSRAG